MSSTTFHAFFCLCKYSLKTKDALNCIQSVTQEFCKMKFFLRGCLQKLKRVTFIGTFSNEFNGKQKFLTVSVQGLYKLDGDKHDYKLILKI